MHNCVSIIQLIVEIWVDNAIHFPTIVPGQNTRSICGNFQVIPPISQNCMMWIYNLYVRYLIVAQYTITQLNPDGRSGVHRYDNRIHYPIFAVGQAIFRNNPGIEPVNYINRIGTIVCKAIPDFREGQGSISI